MTLAFTEDGIDAIADIAVQVNSSVENIGARRLSTVMERVLDKISFDAAESSVRAVTIDAAYVREHIGDLARQCRSAASSSCDGRRSRTEKIVGQGH